jgi:hypothetical protein
MMATRAALILLGAIAVVGCASHERIAALNRINQDNLRALEAQLTLTALGDPAKTQKNRADFAALVKSGDEKKIATFLDAQRKERINEYESRFGDSTEASTRALARAAAAKRDTSVRFPRKEDQDAALLDDLARIQTDFRRDADAAAARAEDLARLYGKLIEAIHALHVNGADIQKYLELNDFQRLRADISGMDRATLEQIGEDLKALRERIKLGK